MSPDVELVTLGHTCNTVDVLASIGPDRLVLLGPVGSGWNDTVAVVEQSRGPVLVSASHLVVAGVHLTVLACEDGVFDAPVSLRPSPGNGDERPLPSASDGIGDLLRSGLAAGSSTERDAVMDFLVRTCVQERAAVPSATVEALHLCRRAIRTRLPLSAIDRAGPRAVKIEAFAAVDERSLYIRGWIGYGSEQLANVVAVGPEGGRVELLPQLHRIRRDDVARFYGEDDDRFGYGFVVLASHDTPTACEPGWLIEVHPRRAEAVEIDAGPDTVTVSADVRALIVADIALERPDRDGLRATVISPAIERLLERERKRVVIEQVEELGARPARPDVSVIVPLYRRVDFVEHQLAQFVHDPEMFDVDLVYVLDSPELATGFLAEAKRLYRFFGLPFRVVVLSHNGGFSTANNFGASVADGRLLMLMNSDVFPDRPGWLSRLVAFHDARPDVGAVGPKLVYEDESIQHAGMYFDRRPGASEWTNEHFYKGLHRTFHAASVSRPVPAVTAACMLIDADLYRRLDGLRGMYVQGDYEDSDLCLRLTGAGRVNWYCADVELYHLEGQSYPTPLRLMNGAYNRWLHTFLWNEEIEQAMAGVDL